MADQEPITVELQDANDPAVKHKVIVPVEVMQRYGLDLQSAVKFVEHQREAGRRGGRSRSPKKLEALKINAAKARAARWERHRLMKSGARPEEVNRPSSATGELPIAITEVSPESEPQAVPLSVSPNGQPRPAGHDVVGQQGTDIVELARLVSDAPHVNAPIHGITEPDPGDPEEEHPDA